MGHTTLVGHPGLPEYHAAVGIPRRHIHNIDKTHRCRVESILYCVPFWVQILVPVSSSCGVMSVVFRDDGGAFALVLCKMGPCPVLTVVCIRAKACVWL